MADTDSSTADAEVAAALGLGEDVETEEVDDGQEDTDQESEEVAFEDLPQKTQDEIRKLRRENAALRVKTREARKTAKTADSSSDVEAAREAGREEARAEHGVELATEAIRAALTGVISDEDLDEFVDELNIARFVTDEHKPDRDAIAALKARQARLTGAAKRKTSVQNGRQGSGAGKKSNADEFAGILTGLLGK